MESLVRTFEKYGYEVKLFEDKNDAKEALLKEIHIDKTVGVGGSMSVDELGIYDDLVKRGNKVYWHWKTDEKNEARNMAKNASIYLASTNAITMDGKLVNMDGTGNRVASMIYGHERVYLIIGKNKMCEDYEDARNRIRNVAAPKNASRFKLNTPCVYTGKCNDCESEQRICMVETIHHRKPKGTNISLFIINEDLGY